MASFELTGVDQLIQTLMLADDLALQGLAAAGYQVMQEIIDVAKSRVPVDLGVLRASGTVLRPVIHHPIVTVEGGFGGAAGDYAMVVHEGRRPGAKMPPYQAIADWVERHGLPPDAVWPIRRKISEDPQPGIKYLESAFLERVGDLPSKLGAGVTVALQRLRP